ncbi:MAG: chromate efflux transporter [Chitinophagaceae bacterium]|nr:chromate efflux transporter [Chitinophagaceae bacterium]
MLPIPIKSLSFLKDILYLSIFSFGGASSHLSLFLNQLVIKKKYLTEKELLEINALCQLVPGPTSTQTLVLIAYKIGKAKLSYLCLLIWCFPAVFLMICSAICITFIQIKTADALHFTRFVQPIAIGMVSYTAVEISKKTITTKSSFCLALVSILISFFFGSPYVFPVLLLLGGAFTGLKYKNYEKQIKEHVHISWKNFILWVVVLIIVAITGNATNSLPILLFENFYRNGSMVFGGGHVLIPFLFSEFVELKKYITSDEFLTGYALQQIFPGPFFSFSAFIGTLSMRGENIYWQIVGGFMASMGIFLPGTFFIFFIYSFWEQLKKYRFVRASIEGINATSTGILISSIFLLKNPFLFVWYDPCIIVSTFILLKYTKVRIYFIVVFGLLCGLFL